MVPVAKKPQLPLAFGNARGVICSSVPAKVYARVWRDMTVPVLQAVAGHLQSGSLPGGGVEAPSMAVRALVACAKAASISMALLSRTSRLSSTQHWWRKFVNLFSEEARRAALWHVGMTTAECEAFGEA